VGGDYPGSFMKLKTRKDVRARRHRRVRRKIGGTAGCPRMSVMVSNKCIYAQFVDDEKGVTLVGDSSRTDGGCSVDAGRKLGKRVAEKAKENGISRFVVDRGGFKFHGRVKAVVDGALEAGLTNKKEEK